MRAVPAAWLASAALFGFFLLWCFFAQKRGPAQPARPLPRPLCIFMWGLWDAAPFPFEEKLARIRRDYGYDCKVLSAADVEAAVAEYATKWNAAVAPCYQSMRRNVCRADLGRYLLIFLRGGLYLDHDVQLLRPLRESEWQSAGGVWVLEKRADPSSLGPRELREPVGERIANYAFGSAVPFLAGLHFIIEECIKRVREIGHLQVWSDSDVLWVTGPDVVSVVRSRHGAPTFSQPLEDFCSHSEAGTWRGLADV